MLKPVNEANIISAETSLLDVAKDFELNNPRELIVVGELGKVYGLLEKASIINLMTNQESQNDRSGVNSDRDREKILQS